MRVIKQVLPNEGIRFTVWCKICVTLRIHILFFSGKKGMDLSLHKMCFLCEQGETIVDLGLVDPCSAKMEIVQFISL